MVIADVPLEHFPCRHLGFPIDNKRLTGAYQEQEFSRFLAFSRPIGSKAFLDPLADLSLSPLPRGEGKKKGCGRAEFKAAASLVRSFP
jgi:hypothetical protein